eukprot:4455713-Amphidinium_carterae.1
MAATSVFQLALSEQCSWIGLDIVASTASETTKMEQLDSKNQGGPGCSEEDNKQLLKPHHSLLRQTDLAYSG